MEVEGEQAKDMISVDLNLHKEKDGTMFWTFTVVEDSKADLSLYVDKQKSSFGNDLVLIIYNETVMSTVLSAVMSMSVIGVYVTIVYAVGRFLRIIFDRYSERVIYEELPETQKLSEIIEGIFIAQLEGDMVNEKRLYDLLIMVYRSPELMIKMTGVRYPYQKELEADDADASAQAASARLQFSAAPELVIDSPPPSQNGDASKKKDD
eukprot:Macronucleus_3726.p1 GENE.Macronucleus_3726~~Macronucleus_3726.p1  ORF type:complete len:208 (+),score=38.87 Macronucleus_3726:1-624(+)